MTTRTAPAVGTRREQAEQRLLVIRNALEVADAELARALAEQDWEVFDLASFEDYCAEKLPELVHIKLRVAARRARTKTILDANPDATERQIGAATGASPATAHRDVLAVTGRSASNEATAERSAAVVSPLTNWQVVARFVVARGAAGATCRELEDKLGWRHGTASAAFNAAEKKGHIRRDGRLRDRYGVYIGAS